jgi:hypothetical protein
MRYNDNVQGGHKLLHLPTNHVIKRRQVTPVPITPAIIKQVDTIAMQEAVPVGLKIKNRTGQIFYDRAWIAGVDYDAEAFEDDLNQEDYEQVDWDDDGIQEDYEEVGWDEYTAVNSVNNGSDHDNDDDPDPPVNIAGVENVESKDKSESESDEDEDSNSDTIPNVNNVMLTTKVKTVLMSK